MGAQLGSIVYKTWFDSSNLIFLYFEQISVNQKSKTILFQKLLKAMYLNQNISLTWQLLQGTAIFLLPAMSSAEQWGSPQSVRLLGHVAVHVAAEQPKRPSSSVPAFSWEHWHFWEPHVQLWFRDFRILLQRLKQCMVRFCTFNGLIQHPWARKRIQEIRISE